jgi:excisionase family DNA binding protein
VSELLLSEPRCQTALTQPVGRIRVDIYLHDREYPRCTRMARTTGDLSDSEVAQALNKSVRTVQRWCLAGRLSGAYKAGRSWRIPWASLDAPHRDAVRRLARGPMGDVLADLRATSERLVRGRDDVGKAGPQTVDDFLAILVTLEAELKTTGKLAADRRRKLAHDAGLARRLRSRAK